MRRPREVGRAHAPGFHRRATTIENISRIRSWLKHSSNSGEHSCTGTNNTGRVDERGVLNSGAGPGPTSKSLCHHPACAGSNLKVTIASSRGGRIQLEIHYRIILRGLDPGSGARDRDPSRDAGSESGTRDPGSGIRRPGSRIRDPGVPMGCRWGADEAFPRGGAGPYPGVPSMRQNDIEHQ